MLNGIIGNYPLQKNTCFETEKVKLLKLWILQKYLMPNDRENLLVHITNVHLSEL